MRACWMVVMLAMAGGGVLSAQNAPPAPAPGDTTPAGSSAGSSTDYTKVTPVDLVKSTPRGKLVNPYKDTQEDVVAQGGKFLLSYACSGCHGGGGGGGMCPPLTNDVWVYGGDDDTLFRLVTLGSVELQGQGYMRKGRENVVGPMPPFGAIIKTADDLWKILAFVRSKYNGDPSYKFGTPPDQE
ncbi:MAG: c-type cytochrome [Steroidobacteraceae bacterium]